MKNVVSWLKKVLNCQAIIHLPNMKSENLSASAAKFATRFQPKILGNGNVSTWTASKIV
jgi:hypothetical protein